MAIVRSVLEDVAAGVRSLPYQLLTTGPSAAVTAREGSCASVPSAPKDDEIPWAWGPAASVTATPVDHQDK